jgi:hypothetical protein
MAPWMHEEKTQQRGRAVAVRQALKRPAEAVARHLILAGSVFVTLLAVFAIEALSSGAATVPKVSPRTSSTSTPTTPKVTMPTVTVTTPTGTTPPTVTTTLTTPPATTPTVTTPPTTTPATTPALTTPALTAPAITSPTVSTPALSSAPPVATGAPGGNAVSAAAQQRQLRSLVVGLSQCLVTLQPQAERVLLLRAGFDSAGSDSPAAVARASDITAVREATIEHSALAELQAAAREQRCPSTLAALIHVPLQDRLVAADPILVSHDRRAASARGSGASVHAVGNGRVTVSFTLSASQRAGAIKTLIVALPGGVTFSGTQRSLTHGILVMNGRGKRVELTPSVSHGKLTIRLRTAERTARVTIATPAVKVSQSVAHQLETGKVKTLRIPVTTMSTKHNRRHVTLSSRAS